MACYRSNRSSDALRLTLHVVEQAKNRYFFEVVGGFSLRRC